jgi:hypothetical protein
MVQPLYRRSSAKAAGESRASENIFNLRRALRHVRGVLQQPHVAGHERGRGEANHLPEGVVPGHHGRNRPQRRGASAQSPPEVEFFQPEFLRNSLLGNREYLFDQTSPGWSMECYRGRHVGG